MEYNESTTNDGIVENGENNNYESTTVQNGEMEKCEEIFQETNEIQTEQNGKAEDGQNIHKLRKVCYLKRNIKAFNNYKLWNDNITIYMQRE